MLPIFPRSGFDQSVTTPVLLGVLASWAMTETFGWVFAGLVVPGYLAAVFLLEPVAGAIDLFEAALTYFAARLIGEHLPRLGVTSRIFGRERFFLVVLVSILVRLAVEGWLLPRFVPHVSWAYSIGLVVVPLTANACWKTGFFRGIVQNGVPTLLVFLLLRWVFVPYTNLSLAGFEVSTENLAAGFLSSPKAYILLITGAMLAAGANLRYGWDFNGILVPALLGLAVVEPVKLAATFVETLVLVFVVSVLLKVTPLGRANIEGPRRTVLFFSVDYALRFAWAGAMGARLPGGDIVAFMGFGYLLPTLLAVKISQKSSAPLVLLPTLKVSLLGFAVGSLIGFGFHRLDPDAEAATPTSTRLVPRAPEAIEAAALWVSQLAIDGIPEPDSTITGDLRKLRATLLAAPHDPLGDGTVLVRERFDTLAARHGTPAYLLRIPLPAKPIVALVPRPLGCPAAAAHAGALLRAGNVDAVVISGIEEPARTWADLETTAHAAARTLAAGGEVRVVRDRNDPRLGKTRPGETEITIDPLEVATRLAPPRPALRLASATEIAARLETIPAATHPGDLEHLVVLRRLVLEPLLATDASPALRALVPLAASALGYELTQPTRWPGGGEGVALLPTARGLPLAMLVRTTGVTGTIVEAPTRSTDGARDLAIRLAVALDADALVVGEVFDGAMRGGAVRAAHGAATNGRAPAVVVVREDRTLDDVTLASWMDDGARAGTRTRAALVALGASPTDVPASLATRDLATRTLLEPTAVVAVTAGGKHLAALALGTTRRAHASLPAIPTRDGTVADAAASLARELEPGMPPARDGIDEVARHAAGEASITAAHALADELAHGAVRAAIVRAKEGSFVVAVARTERASLVVVAPLDGSNGPRERRTTLAACLAQPPVPGTCEAPR